MKHQSSYITIICLGVCMGRGEDHPLWLSGLRQPAVAISSPSPNTRYLVPM